MSQELPSFFKGTLKMEVTFSALKRSIVSMQFTRICTVFCREIPGNRFLKDLMARRRFSPRSGSVHVHLEVLDTGSPVVYLSNHRCGALSRGKVKHGGNSKLGHVQKQLFFPKTNDLCIFCISQGILPLRTNKKKYPLKNDGWFRWNFLLTYSRCDVHFHQLETPKRIRQWCFFVR